jgi:hypothetical protein
VLECDAILFCREAIFGLNSREVSSSPKNDGLDEVNEAILLALSDEPFYSVRHIARKICVPKGSEYHRLVDSLQFTVRRQTSSLSSSQALRQSEGKSIRVVDPTSRPPVVLPCMLALDE